jgi:mannose-1-phosphate guanylyltransferase
MTAAMLMAAGYGNRLRPLTSVLPKPLVPVGLQALLDRHLDVLSDAGIGDVAINASHLADRIESHLALRSAATPAIHLLRERKPLGIGGGLLGARRILEGSDRFLVVNADVFHGIDLRGVLAAHERRDADAMLVVRRARAGEPADELSIRGDAVVTGVPGTASADQRWRFTGIHVLTPAVFDFLSAPGDIVTAYRDLLRRDRKVVAYDCGDAAWFDVGSPASYLEANLAEARRSTVTPSAGAQWRLEGASLIAPSAKVGPGCVIGPATVIGPGATVGRGARLSNSVVWPAVEVAPGEVLERAIAYPGGTLVVDGHRRQA